MEDIKKILSEKVVIAIAATVILVVAIIATQLSPRIKEEIEKNL